MTLESRKQTSYAMIDRMINQLNRRFSSDACSVLKGAAALDPKHGSFLDKQAMLRIASNYGVAEVDLTMEVKQLK